MAQIDPAPAYEAHDSAFHSSPAKRELLRDERPESRFLDQVEQVVAVQKERTGTRFTEFDIFRHGKSESRTKEQNRVADRADTQPSRSRTKHCSSKS